MSAESDAELLARWADNDRDAANALFERYFDPLYRFFRSKVAANLEDLVQETFLAAIAGRERLRETSSFRGYLFGVARNLVRQRLRRHRVRGDKVDMLTHSVADVSPGMATAIGEKREHRLLSQALRDLPADYQIALELFYWEQLTGPELADALDLTEAAVRSRLHRAKQALRARIEELGSSAALIQSTWDGLDGWASDIAAEFAPEKS